MSSEVLLRARDCYARRAWSDAIIGGLSGTRPMPSARIKGTPQTLEEALAGYQRQRDAFAFPLYDLICQLASMEVPPPELQALQTAMAGNDEAITAFFRVLDGIISVPEFLAEENIGCIMARAHERRAA